MTSDPHAREYAAAAAGMAEVYGSVWRPAPGQRVIAPRPFGGGHEEVTVIGRVGQSDVYRVRNAAGEEPQYFLEELSRI